MTFFLACSFLKGKTNGDLFFLVRETRDARPEIRGFTRDGVRIQRICPKPYRNSGLWTLGNQDHGVNSDEWVSISQSLFVSPPSRFHEREKPGLSTLQSSHSAATVRVQGGGEAVSIVLGWYQRLG